MLSASLLSAPLQTYTHIIRNKQFASAGRLRVNMGNCYFEQRRYPNAIKMYRMALDQVPSNAKDVRFRIMRNIGHAFARLGQYQDALQAAIPWALAGSCGAFGPCRTCGRFAKT